jgi:hypothetical protein
MSIRVVCPNGHPLRVQESSAGKTGQCPVCKALVKVPMPAEQPVSEDAILDFLGPHQPGRNSSPVPTPERSSTKPPAEGPVPPKKSCGRCNQEISAETHVCPYCHTYVGGGRLV